MPMAGGSGLAAYVPEDLLERWAAAGAPAGGLTFEAVALIVDVVDSTGMTDRYSALGRQGAERLSGILSDEFAFLVALVERHGGSIARIAGDALTAVWAIEGRDVTRSARNALASAREIAAKVGGEISHRIAVDFGPITLSVLGDTGGRRFALVSGEPLRAMAPGRLRGAPGEVCVADVVLDMSRRDEVEHGRRNPPNTVVGRAWGLRDFVPPPVLTRVEAGLGDWLAEFRTLSVVYVGLADLSAAEIAKAFHIVDAVARDAGAAVWDVIDEDKGVVIKVIFGLPPYATETDAVWAVDVASRALSALQSAGLVVDIGVATGRAFCGEVGGASRREHIAVGPVMNYGARLMQASDGSVLCDEATSRAAAGVFGFGEPVALTIKGRESPLEARCLLGLGDSRAVAADAASGSPPVGRLAACRMIDTGLNALMAGPAGTVLIRGEPGVGKTRLLQYAASQGLKCDLIEVLARGARTERNTPFFVFRQVLQGLVGLTSHGADFVATFARVRDLLIGDRLAGRVNLLNDIFPMLGHPHVNESLSGSTRRMALEDLAVGLFHRATLVSPCLLLVDDLQWADSASSDLLRAVGQRCPRVFLIMGARHSSLGSGHGVQSVLAAVETVVDLDRLDPDDTEALVASELGVERLPRRLGAFIHDRSGGLPLHAQQLALSLLERGLVTIANRRCDVAPGALIEDAAPDSLRGLITERIDRLDPLDQLTAKAASVIGLAFDLDCLSEIHPGKVGSGRIGQSLEHLVAAGFVAALGGGQYVFEQALFRETLYELMPFAQRSPLHVATARRIEAGRGTESGARHAELAWHWEQGGEIARAIIWRMNAAWSALQVHADADALDHVTLVRRMAGERGQRLSSSQLVRLERIHADACQGLARFSEAGLHFRACASHAGLTIPESRPAVVASLVAEIFARLAASAGWVLPYRSIEATERDRLAAHVYMRLAEHAYFINDPLALMQRTLASLNHAERCGSSIERTVGYGGLAVGLGVAGLAGPAKSNAERAVLLAAGSGGGHELGLAHLMATVALFPGGDWRQTADHAASGAHQFEVVGDEFRRQSCAVLLAYAQLAQGDRAATRETLSRVPDASADIETASVRAWSASCRAVLDLVSGEAPLESIAVLNTSLSDLLSRADRLVCLGPLAEAHLTVGGREKALECLGEALEILRTESPATGISYVSLPRLVDCSLALGKTHWAELALKSALAFAGKARIARPHVRYVAGRLAAHTGRIDRARAHWRIGLAEAVAISMPYEAALCRDALRGDLKSPDGRMSTLAIADRRRI